jgi:hypothetical protein
MGQELEPDLERCRRVEQVASFLRRQLRYACEVKGNPFLERAEDLFERPALDRDVEIEADRLPIAVATLSIATQTSVRQL